jgi:hypothetical protein
MSVPVRVLLHHSTVDLALDTNSRPWAKLSGMGGEYCDCMGAPSNVLAMGVIVAMMDVSMFM